jgi:putative phosphoesterase
LVEVDVAERVALVYDVHGNVSALEAVLAAARREGIEGIVCGGDVALFGAHPAECIERLDSYGDGLVAVRGNCDRYLADPPASPEDELEVVWWTRGALGERLVARLGALPLAVKIEEHGALVVHASPRSDEDVILPETPPEEVIAMLAGVDQPLVICGHTHLQYRRALDGIELVNPGSVGLPLDGDPRAAWGVLQDGRVQFRRTAYDVEGVIAELDQIGHPTAKLITDRLRRAAE